MSGTFIIKNTVDELVAALAERFCHWLNSSVGKRTMALSGGSTPSVFFQTLARKAQLISLPWDRLHLFWGDERCVPPDHPESNYGMTRQLLLSRVPIPATNVHRIFGENEPEKEARRYAREMKQYVPMSANGLPRFDWILLGLGSDGHTASLFPGDIPKVEPDGLCAVTIHPASGQRRITISMPVIKNAGRVSFLVTGKQKATIVRRIVNADTAALYPAAYVQPDKGQLEWWLDKAAARLL